MFFYPVMEVKIDGRARQPSASLSLAQGSMCVQVARSKPKSPLSRVAQTAEQKISSPLVLIYLPLIFSKPCLVLPV